MKLVGWLCVWFVIQREINEKLWTHSLFCGRNFSHAASPGIRNCKSKIYRKKNLSFFVANYRKIQSRCRANGRSWQECDVEFCIYFLICFLVVFTLSFSYIELVLTSSTTTGLNMFALFRLKTWNCADPWLLAAYLRRFTMLIACYRVIS